MEGLSAYVLHLSAVNTRENTSLGLQPEYSVYRNGQHFTPKCSIYRSKIKGQNQNTYCPKTNVFINVYWGSKYSDSDSEYENNKSPGLDGFTVEFFKCF